MGKKRPGHSRQIKRNRQQQSNANYAKHQDENAQDFIDSFEPVTKHPKSQNMVVSRPTKSCTNLSGNPHTPPEQISVDTEDMMEECEDRNIDEDEDKSMMMQQSAKVWHPKVHGEMEKDEVLEFDSSAYSAYYSLHVEWPCLSFDIIRDELGSFRSRFPIEFTIAAGTQATSASKNSVNLWRVRNLRCTRKDDMSDDDDDDDDDDDAEDDNSDGVSSEAQIEQSGFKHCDGGINRLRSCPQKPQIISTWSDSGSVHIWDVSVCIDSLNSQSSDRRRSMTHELSALQSFSGHASEGFAMDWSPVTTGKLVTGDCSKFIYNWSPNETGWTVDKMPYRGHTASVEDLQWSPTESNVFSSCSVDKSIRIWDTRTHSNSMLSVDGAHEADVNVLSWNSNVGHLLASGSDDGSFKVWDLRIFRSGEPAGFFKWHEAPITSVQWHPTQESMIGVTSEDDSCTIWDMSVELDQDAQADGADLDGVDIPPQLLFIHRGQKHLKELHFHPQIPSLITTTAVDGFNFFKPDNLER